MEPYGFSLLRQLPTACLPPVCRLSAEVAAQAGSRSAGRKSQRRQEAVAQVGSPRFSWRRLCLPTEVPDFRGEGCACPPPVYRLSAEVAAQAGSRSAGRKSQRRQEAVAQVGSPRFSWRRLCLPTEVPDFRGEGCACPPPVYRLSAEVAAQAGSRSVGRKQSTGWACQTRRL